MSCWTSSRDVCFHSISNNFYKKCRLKLDSKSDRCSLKWALWPQDNHQNPDFYFIPTGHSKQLPMQLTAVLLTSSARCTTRIEALASTYLVTSTSSSWGRRCPDSKRRSEWGRSRTSWTWRWNGGTERWPERREQRRPSDRLERKRTEPAWAQTMPDRGRWEGR